MSRPAAIAAGIYLLLAIALLIQDYLSQPTPGAWISLRNIVPFIVTFPISAPLSLAGMEPDLSNKWTVSVLVIACAALIYQAVAFVAGLFTSR